jgi:hypothetical protein
MEQRVLWFFSPLEGATENVYKFYVSSITLTQVLFYNLPFFTITKLNTVYNFNYWWLINVWKRKFYYLNLFLYYKMLLQFHNHESLDTIAACFHFFFGISILFTFSELPSSASTLNYAICAVMCYVIIIKRVSWFKSSLLLRIKTDYITNINS